MNKTKIVILGIAALFTVLTVATASATPTLHFVPSDSSVPEGYCNTTTVEIRLNLSEGDNITMGQFGFSYDPLCGDLIDRTLNEGYPPDYPIDPSWSSWNVTTYPDCWNETMDWIVFKFRWPHDGPKDILIGTITLHCNSTEYCTNEMNFGWIPGCDQGSIILWNGDQEEVPYSTINGTFECGEAPSPETFEKGLVSGWNLISLPLTNETDMTIANIIDTSLSGSYDALYKYDASTHNFVSLSSSDTMENGVGYFINMTASDTWTYTGSAAYTDMSNSLEHGLNMIGGLNCPKSISEALSSIEGNYNYITRWNAHSQEFEVYVPGAPFNEFNTMERGEGYFISAKEGCPPLTENCSA